MVDALANSNVNEVGMIIAACTRGNKWTVGFAKEKAQRTKAAQIALAAAIASDLQDFIVLRKQCSEFINMC